MVAPLTETSKQPVRGFSSLIFTVAPGKPAFTRASSLEALVLNAPQLLHASILTTQPPSADEASPLERIVACSTAFEGDFLAFLSMVFFGGMINVYSVRKFAENLRDLADTAPNYMVLNRDFSIPLNIAT